MTRYKVIFSAHALHDIEKACDYYNLQQKNLGKRFVKQVENTLQSIRTNPFYTISDTILSVVQLYQSFHFLYITQ
jgi:hypothetical protein